MRILYVTPYVPSPIRVRPYNFIRSLAKRHSITLVALAQSEIDYAAIGEMEDVCDRVKTVGMSVRQSLIRAGKGLLTRMPMQAAYTYLPKLMVTVSEELADRPYDVLHVEHIRAAHYAGHINFMPTVYDSVDCITLLLRQMLVSKRNLLAWLITLEEWAKMRVYEGLVAQRFTRIITTSETDGEALEDLIRQRIGKRLRQLESGLKGDSGDGSIEEWRITRWLAEMAQDQRLNSLMAGSSRVDVIPNGVDFDYFRPIDKSPDPDTIVFTGKMSYHPNAAAARRFCSQIFPLIKARRPNAKLRIVGYKPPGSVRKLAADPSINVTGYVDDIRPHIASSAVAVCPISVGVGIQNKVLEAMAMGKPVVCASIAQRAIKAADGKELICADSPTEFADAVVHILERPDMQRSLGDNALAYVRRNHSWDDMAGRLEQTYREAKELFKREITGVA